MFRIVLYNKCKNVYGTLYSINSNISSFDTPEANSILIKPVVSVILTFMVCDCVVWVELYVRLDAVGNKLFYI